MTAYDDLHLFTGDLHSHCNIGYGHGSIEDSYRNARLQLDFACVTAHSWWADMPEADVRLAQTVAYHRAGFQRTAETWPAFREVVEANHAPGRFISFLGCEWHSMAYGDHHIVFGSPAGEIIPAADLDEMRRELRTLAARGVPALLIPHHIGYRRGYRGINWDAFTPEFSPVVEIMSMHGCSESDEAACPMLHTMGPRDGASTYQHGLAAGHIVGAVGSTDHHSAHPGSYGHGRVAVWADALTRDGILAALRARRCYALTGDRIDLRFSINGAPLGSALPPADVREIAVEVRGGAALDTIELLHNNRVIERWRGADATVSPWAAPLKVCLEVGWGEKGHNVDWDVVLAVTGGRLLGVEPRFRGHDVVAPQAGDEECYAFSRWERLDANAVHFATRTWGNPTTTTAGTQAICLELAGDAATRLHGTINGIPVAATLGELLAASSAGYLGGFLTPAHRFHRAVPAGRFAGAFTLRPRAPGPRRDWYTVRVRQINDQWAWSSPVWVG